MNKSPRLFRRLLAAAAVALLAASAVACSPASQAEDEPQVLRIAAPIVPASFDPALSNNGRAGIALQPAYEPLVRTNSDGTFEPALAVEWSLSEDRRVAKFTLREDAKFSDGEPVNAEAAKASIEYYLSVKGPSQGNTADIEGVNVIDEYTFEVVSTAPNPELIRLFDHYWMAGLLISPNGVADPDKVATQPMGAGQYVFDSAASAIGTKYVFTPNEYYYDQDRIHWDRIEISIFPESASAVQAMKAGQIDVYVADAFVANQSAESLSQDGFRAEVSDVFPYTVTLMTIDRTGERNPAYADLRVRQALNYAIDRETLSAAVFGEYGAPAEQIIPLGWDGNNPDLDERYPYDPDKARELLAEAGYPDGFELKTVTVGYSQNRQLAQIITEMFAKVGVTMTTLELTSGTVAAAADGTADAMLNLIGGGPAFIAHNQAVGLGNFNPLKTQTDELSALLAKAKALPADEARGAWEDVYEYTVESAWFVPLAYVSQPYFFSDKVEAIDPGRAIDIDVINMRPSE